jgi:hypothetical protein
VFSNKDGQEKTAPHEGQTITFELKDGKYVASAEEGSKLSEKELQGLAKKAPDPDSPGMEKAFLPKEPVKLNQSWKLDAAELSRLVAKAGSLKVKANDIKGSGKLAKVYTRKGKQFGVIEFEINLEMNELQGKALDPPAKIHAKGSLDTAIDGSTSAGVMEMTTSVAIAFSPDGNRKST